MFVMTWTIDCAVFLALKYTTCLIAIILSNSQSNSSVSFCTVVLPLCLILSVMLCTFFRYRKCSQGWKNRQSGRGWGRSFSRSEFGGSPSHVWPGGEVPDTNPHLPHTLVSPQQRWVWSTSRMKLCYSVEDEVCSFYYNPVFQNHHEDIISFVSLSLERNS
jgi:hypothetical protein